MIRTRKKKSKPGKILFMPKFSSYMKYELSFGIWYSSWGEKKRRDFCEIAYDFTAIGVFPLRLTLGFILSTLNLEVLFIDLFGSESAMEMRYKLELGAHNLDFLRTSCRATIITTF